MEQRSAANPGSATVAACAATGLLLSLSLCAGTAAAASPPSGDVRANAFDLLDHNSDGRISYSEAKADPALRGEYKRLDKDKDGGLDRGEFARFEARSLNKHPGILTPQPSKSTEKVPHIPSKDSQFGQP